jgi:putative ATPase
MEPDLFNQSPKPEKGERPGGAPGGHRPLAARMRPRRLSEVVGQDHVLGTGCLLPRLIESDTFGSLLFYGPPGTGKTSIAQAIAEETGSRFVQINAVLSNTAELRDILRMARHYPDEKTILFIDEIHRFNKAQQDLLLPDVEAGHIRLIGATTHNPGFYVNPPLLSRSHLFKLEPVSLEAIVAVLESALADDARGLGAMRVTADRDFLERLARMSDGDLRRALNSLETIVLGLGTYSEPGPDRAGPSREPGPDRAGPSREEKVIPVEGRPPCRPLLLSDLKAFAKERQIRYDANEDEHYDTASAFIKSMRGSDPDASLYWLAKMLSGGEDPRFIARRLVIFASEDVGLADPRALPMAVACKDACEFVGLPECELNLAHVTVFLATCPKSNSTTLAIGRAKASIREKGLQPVPLWLRDAHTKFNKSLGQGKDYKYSHDFPDADSGQTYMEQPERFYEPKEAGLEARIKEWLSLRRKS